MSAFLSAFHLGLAFRLLSLRNSRNSEFPMLDLTFPFSFHLFRLFFMFFFLHLKETFSRLFFPSASASSCVFWYYLFRTLLPHTDGFFMSLVDSFCLSVCPSICLSVYLSVCLSLRLSGCLSFRFSLPEFMCPQVSWCEFLNFGPFIQDVRPCKSVITIFPTTPVRYGRE